MPSIFSKIVNKEIPSYKVAENEEFLAFLDIFPLAKGHTLVIPKHETDYIFDIESDEYARLWQFAQKVAKAQKKVIPCERIGVAVIGLEIPHAHIHLIPLMEFRISIFLNLNYLLLKKKCKRLLILLLKYFSLFYQGCLLGRSSSQNTICHY